MKTIKNFYPQRFLTLVFMMLTSVWTIAADGDDFKVKLTDNLEM